MKTFTTINNTTFTTNENETYFYAIYEMDGKQTKKRIPKKEFEQAEREHELEVSRKMDEAMNKLMEEENRRQNEQNEFTNVSFEDLEAKVAKIEESETTEEVKGIQKKMKKTRKSKDVAFSYDFGGTHGVLTLTAKQVDFIKHLPDTCFWEDGLDSVIWVDCLCDDIGGQFKDKPMTVGAMISTLCEKGLGSRATERRNGRKCTSFRLTPSGKFIAKELGLE